MKLSMYKWEKVKLLPMILVYKIEILSFDAGARANPFLYQGEKVKFALFIFYCSKISVLGSYASARSNPFFKNALKTKKRACNKQALSSETSSHGYFL